MATEPRIIRLQIDADGRLAAAAGGVARYLADATCMESDAVGRLQATIVAACEEAFQNLQAGHTCLQVSFTRHEDRIEVALTHKGEAAPAVGLDTIAGFATQLGNTASGAGTWAGVDRVQFETHDGIVLTRLTKYLNPGSPGSEAP
ncbi:MAG: hypothetical protein ACRD36_01805 [Candidatus Acidiferrum sp.]